MASSAQVRIVMAVVSRRLAFLRSSIEDGCAAAVAITTGAAKMGKVKIVLFHDQPRTSADARALLLASIDAAAGCLAKGPMVDRGHRHHSAARTEVAFWVGQPTRSSAAVRPPQAPSCSPQVAPSVMPTAAPKEEPIAKPATKSVRPPADTLSAAELLSIMSELHELCTERLSAMPGADLFARRHGSDEESMVPGVCTLLEAMPSKHQFLFLRAGCDAVRDACKDYKKKTRRPGRSS